MYMKYFKKNKTFQVKKENFNAEYSIQRKESDHKRADADCRFSGGREKLWPPPAVLPVSDDPTGYGCGKRENGFTSPAI